MALRVCVIGAGPAGMTAASVAAQNGFQTVLIEHGERVGRKILLTGNGKCNFTNLHLDESCYHAGTEKFAARALSHFGADDAVRWFRTLGIEPLENRCAGAHRLQREAHYQEAGRGIPRADRSRDDRCGPHHSGGGLPGGVIDRIGRKRV